MPQRVEQEILDASRGFADAQLTLQGSIDIDIQRIYTQACWYDSSTNEHEGCFALVNSGSDLESLVGDIVLVTYKKKSVWVYIVAATNLPTDIGLFRSAWIRIADLAEDEIGVRVEVRL